MIRPLLAPFAALLATACAGPATSPAPASPPSPPSSAPVAAACPKDVPAGARCLTGRDAAGAHYWIAMPQAWNGTLVLHAHGGPELGEPKPERSAEDLTRWAIMVKAGYAWAGSTFRQGGVEVRSAAEDTERLRRLFVEHVAKPKRTILHGQSWGAGVAAKGAEMFASPSPYDAVLLTSGVLAGGTRSYDVRLDLRVVYQAVCNNHPRPDEPQYPLWQGLPPDSKLTRAELAARVDECTGLRSKPEARTEAQRRSLKAILDAVRIPERSLQGHLNWGTWHFQDIVFKRLNGGNPFGNIGADYGDPALNARVARYAADPQAVARFAADTDPTGRVPVPVLSAHAINDAVAFVELESAFRETMERAGSGARLVQVYTDESEHSYLSDPEYPAMMAALLAWVERGEKPTPQSVAERCRSFEATFGPGCKFLPDYRPAPLEARVPARRR